MVTVESLETAKLLSKLEEIRFSQILVHWSGNELDLRCPLVLGQLTCAFSYRVSYTQIYVMPDNGIFAKKRQKNLHYFLLSTFPLLLLITAIW